MKGKRFLREIRMRGLLSYGDELNSIELEPLNVLIGPNASGKSNLIEVIALLASTPNDFAKAVRAAGGVDALLWKGGFYGDKIACLGFIVQYVKAKRIEWADYEMWFTGEDSRPRIVRERLENVRRRDEALIGNFKTAPDSTILERFRDPDRYEALTYIAKQLGRIAMFRDWNCGRSSLTRQPQRADLPDDFLLEDGSNLALILNDFENRPKFKADLLDKLRGLYRQVENFTTKVQGGTIQIFFHEEGLSQPIPAARLSDGTLRYLCLLSILCHPEPPPLICLEEPEVGLHPDVIPEVAKLLVEASQRTQLVVTTHSEMLVSALSEVPEAVIVCERGQDGTRLQRLEPDKLKEWLENYRLGELWNMGELGGNP